MKFCSNKFFRTNFLYFVALIGCLNGILSFGAGSWEIKQKGDQKVLIYRMYLDDEVSLPLIFIQKLRINHAVDIFNDVLTFSQGEK